MSDINSISINGVEYIPASAAAKYAAHISKPEGRYAIVRCRNAGVHAGYVKSRKDGVVTLENSRRLWRWWSKFTLSGLAVCGVLPSKVDEVKFGCVVSLLDLTECDVCEVIYTTQKARESIQGIQEHSNE